jgi:glycosyltransferase involved in cell wall biosynthesis
MVGIVGIFFIDMSHRILYISYSGNIGGAEISLYNLVKRIDPSRFEPIVICPESGDLVKKLRADGINTLISPLLPWRKFKSFPFRNAALEHLVKLAQEQGVSLVHCNTIWANPYAQRVGEVLSLPVICHLRDIIKPEQVRKYDLHKIDLIIPVSEAVAKPLREFNVPNEKIKLIYNGVDVDEFMPSDSYRAELRSELGLSPKGFVVAIAAQITPKSGWKGHHDFLYAASEVIRLRPKLDVKFLIVGGDKKKMSTMPTMPTMPTMKRSQSSPLVKLKALADSLGISPHVIFTGFRNDMPKVMNGIDVLVSASTAEPFGRTLIEAMACAKAVIATNSGGAPEIVEDGATGFLTTPSSPASLANVIIRILDEPELGRKLGENGRRRAVEKFSLLENMRQMEMIYESFTRKPMTLGD